MNVIDQQFETLAKQLENLNSQSHDLVIKYSRGVIDKNAFHYQSAVFLGAISHVYNEFCKLHLSLCTPPEPTADE